MVLNAKVKIKNLQSLLMRTQYFNIKLLLIIVCLTVQIASEQDYQCQTDKTVSENLYDMIHSSGPAEELEEFKGIYRYMANIDDQGFTWYYGLFYLVKVSSTAPQNILRVKSFKGNGQQIQINDLVLSDQITFVDFKLGEGVVVTSDGIIKFLRLYQMADQIHVQSTFDLGTQLGTIMNVPPSTVVDGSDWIPLRLVYTDWDWASILFQQGEGSTTFHQVVIDNPATFYIDYSITLPDKNFQSSYFGMLYHSTSPTTGDFYQDGAAKTLSDITIYGNEKKFGISYYDGKNMEFNKMTVIWNHNGNSNQTYLHLYSIKQSDHNLAYIRTITSDLFSDFNSIDLHYSGDNQHFVKHDGTHLRYSLALGSSEYYSYETVQGDKIQVEIAGGLAIQFAFFNHKMFIMTNTDKMHQVTLIEENYDSSITDIQSRNNVNYAFKKLVLDTDIELKRTLTLGTDTTAWLDNLDQQFIITKTTCTCVEKGVSHMECFENSVCIFVASSQYQDCTNVQYQILTDSF